MSQIIAIARNTFKEAIRNRILYVILIFALLLIGFSGVVSKLTITSREKIVMDMGFMAISLFGVAIAIFVGVSLVYNELEKKSIYTIVSKPLSRWQFLLGKYFGLLMTVWVNILIMTFFFLVTIHFYVLSGEDGSVALPLGKAAFRSVVNLVLWNQWSYTAHIMPVIMICCLEMAVVTAFAIFFSSFSTPALSMIFTVLTFVAGRMNESIISFADFMSIQTQRMAKATGGSAELPFSYYFATVLAHISPNLGAFKKAVEVAIYRPQEGGLIWWEAIPYNLLYTAGVLCLSMLIFQRRNFK